MQSLAGRVALVTGAGSGIGRAIAEGLALSGARVCLVGRRPEKLAAVQGALAGAGHSIKAVDLGVEHELDALQAHLEANHPTLDMLVLSAGAIARGAVATTPAADLDELYRVNVRANYRLVQVCLPRLRHPPGQIVVINSSAGLSSQATVGQYAASKHALRALTDALRAEVNPEGIRVLSVYPGRTATPMQEGLYAEDGKTYQPEVLLQPQDVAEVVLTCLRLPATAEVTDLSIRPLKKSY